ncbi:MAG: radical SAM protein [Coriobacteriia bacterium]|nr:radical SAM protein [Coriobacteriia bacterium]
MPHEQVEEQVKCMLDAGIKEVVLSGVDIGAYNDNGFGLEDLCKSLLEIIGDRVARIRISSIEPNNVSDDLIDIIAGADGKICRHLHMPLQSGSSKVLKEMARHYNADEYLEVVNRLKKKIPSIALSTDIIVGFPGESDADFKDSIEVSKKCGFMKIHVFPYSKRQGTPAAERPDQINDEVKNDRAKVLRELSDELAVKDFKSRAESIEDVLVENEAQGRSESYHLLDLPEGFTPGDLIKVQL